MKKEKCRECNKELEKLERVKGYCKLCYGRKYYQSRRIKKKDVPLSWIHERHLTGNGRHKAEHEFVQNYLEAENLLYEPVTFRLTNGTTYTPDFYDVVTNVFFEIVGSRQAYYHNKSKYLLMAKQYPKVVFKIVTPKNKEYRGNSAYRNVLTASKAAKIAGCTHPTIIYWINAGKIKAIKKQGFWQLDQTSFNHWLNQAKLELF